MKTTSNPKTSEKNKQLAKEALDVILEIQSTHRELENQNDKDKFIVDVFGSFPFDSFIKNKEQ